MNFVIHDVKYICLCVIFSLCFLTKQGEAETFGGIGVVVNQVVVEDQQQQQWIIPFIFEVIPDSPAFEQGILAGDILTHIDGDLVIGKTLEFIAENIRGERGSWVTLHLYRGTEERLFEVAVKRREITIPDPIEVSESTTRQLGECPYDVATIEARRDQLIASSRALREQAEGWNAPVTQVMIDLSRVEEIEAVTGCEMTREIFAQAKLMAQQAQDVHNFHMNLQSEQAATIFGHIQNILP